MLIGHVRRLAIKTDPTIAIFAVYSFRCSLGFAIKFGKGHFASVHVVDSVGMMGISVVYFCEPTVFICFVTFAAAAAQGAMCSWHLGRSRTLVIFIIRLVE
jgi:hypothetical protein